MAGDPYFYNVALLLHGEGTNNGTVVTDSSMYGSTTWICSGNAKTSTSQYKFGSSSFVFDGTTDFLASTDDFRQYVIGGEDFTIEFHVYFNVVNVQQNIFDYRPPGANGGYATIYLTSAGAIKYFMQSADRISGATLSATTWYHIALCKSGTSTKLFVDGTQSGATYTDTQTFYLSHRNGSNYRPIIGASATSEGASSVNGYIDNVRITIGTARYTSDFTAPSAAYPDNAGTISGNITETLGISKWRITANRMSDGKLAGMTTTTGSSYTLNCWYPDDVLMLTCAPHIDYAWTTGITAAVGEICVPSNPETTPHLFECTTGGAVGGSEPTWNTTPTGTTTDNSAVWTCIGPLVDPVTLGAKIPS